MQKIIVFDLFRTLYDPDKDALINGVSEVLRTLKKRGYKLYLISRLEGNRQSLIKELGIHEYFDDLVFNYQKVLDDFEMLLKAPDVDTKNSFVIGDVLSQEIYFGNSCGAQTVWIQAVKYRNQSLGSPLEKPTFTVNNLTEILSIIK